MKRRFVALVVSTIVAVSLVACGKENVQPEPVIEEPVETVQVEEPVESEPAALTDDERAEVFTNYTDGLSTLAGKSFTISGDYTDEEGIKGVVDSDSGVLYWVYENDNLITAEYDADNNTLVYKSLTVNDAKEIEEVSQVSIDDFIEFSDDTEVLFTIISPEVGKNVIMVEYRSLAYTYADGVKYKIALIDIADDGKLSTIYEDGLAGSGDEDITATIRKGFNNTTGLNYDKETFEDAFYNGNLLIEQDNKPVHASIVFKSETGKLADAGDWDGVNEIVNQIFELPTTNGAPVYWGKGQFLN